MRQNIDEKWKTDPRRRALVKRLGSDRLADGMRVEINWLVLAHKGQPIPLKEFGFVDNYQDWLDCGLGEVVDESVRILGADEYAGFFEKQKTNASKGGKAKAAKRNPKLPKAAQTRPECPSSSSSSSSSSSNSNFKSISNEMVPAGADPNPMGVYIKAYQEKYGTRPEVGDREGKILKTFAKNHPGRWAELIRGYLEMPDSWAVARSHPVEVLVAKVNEIGRFLATGKVVTKIQAREFDEQVTDEMGPKIRPIEEILADRERKALP